MNTVMDTTVIDTVPDGLTVSMVEVDAAAARAALADHLQLAPVDLEHPAVVAVLAAVVSAGWRPPTSPGGSRIVTDPAADPQSRTLFGDAVAITAAGGSAPPGWPG